MFCDEHFFSAVDRCLFLVMLFPCFPQICFFIALLPNLILLSESVIPLPVLPNLAALPESTNTPIIYAFSHTKSNIRDS